MIKPYICFNFSAYVDSERIVKYNKWYIENIDDVFKYYNNCLNDMKAKHGSESLAKDNACMFIDFCLREYNDITGDISLPYQEWYEGSLRTIRNKQPIHITFHYHNLNDIINDKLMLTQMFESFCNSYLNKEN